MGSPDSRLCPIRPGLSDAEIIDHVIAGDLESYDELIRRYRGLVFQIVRNRLPPGAVEEIAHDAFVSAYRALPTFKRGRKFSPWLATIALRLCYRYWRDEYRSRARLISPGENSAPDWLETITSEHSLRAFEESRVRKEAGELLQWALGQLPDQERMALEMVYLDGRSYKDSARVLGWSLAKLKIRIFRARKRLRKALSAFMKAPGEIR